MRDPLPSRTRFLVNYVTGSRLYFRTSVVTLGEPTLRPLDSIGHTLSGVAAIKSGSMMHSLHILDP